MAASHKNQGDHVFGTRKKSFDDLLREVYLRLLSTKGVDEVQSTKGRSLEVFGAHLELSNPRARISRSIQRSKVFSAIGEFIWYVSGSKDLAHIKYYISGYADSSDDAVTLNGAYGPRIFGTADGDSAWSKAIERLSSAESRETRNAVIPIARKDDFLSKTKDRPCTCTLQFVVRRGRLHMQVHMRSNDVYLGLPHDVFCFTMLQELAARQIGVGLGSYIHSVGSLHLYADPRVGMMDHRGNAQIYIDEGLYSHKAMPPMPKGSQTFHIEKVIAAEAALRQGNLGYLAPVDLPDFWQDIVTMLRAYGFSKVKGAERAKGLLECLNALHNAEFGVYIRDRMQSGNGVNFDG